jgi:hypothetical protein
MGEEPSQPASRRHVVLGDLLGLVGPGMLTVLAAPGGLAVPVGAVVIQDPLAPAHLPREALVLAVGIDTEGNGSRKLLEEAAAAMVSAVVFREHPTGTSAVVDHANRLGVIALGMPEDGEWAHLFGRLRTALVGAACDEGVPDTLGAPIGDLFALADAIAALVGGPVTIEDPHSEVLAYSSTSEPIDEPRRSTILGRHSPAAWSRRLRDAGVFRRLWEGEVVRYEAPDIEGFAPRLAVGVRAGDEVLGSIWVAEGSQGFGPEAEPALQRAAHVAALHLVHRRAVSDVQRVARGEHLRSLLDGHGAVEPLAAALDLDPHQPFVVLAARLVAEDDESLEAARELTVGLVSLHVGFLRQRATSVVIGDAVYVLVPDEPPLPATALDDAAREIAERLGQLRGVQARVVIGPRVADLADVRESRRVADDGLRVLERMPHVHVARTADLADQILLLETAQTIQQWPELLHGKLDVLVAHDGEHGTEYVRTLRAYLDAFGDVALAADCLGVHPNTLRYRLHRIVTLAGLDLDDPDERLAVELRLRFR